MYPSLAIYRPRCLAISLYDQYAVSTATILFASSPRLPPLASPPLGSPHTRSRHLKPARKTSKSAQAPSARRAHLLDTRPAQPPSPPPRLPAAAAALATRCLPQTPRISTLSIA
ncbi:uncharacterized protein SCHCODRAFT_01080864 [Schizophyllum commune H4-8]|nr:uncharacterized protein SCHCODRAFT_01080864 [Schizophyllum commune H4-8]KAI5897292.1 hypothetical protein SCHCODRAFT_01080864 [Schizophyllum commune H4-8]